MKTKNFLKYLLSCILIVAVLFTAASCGDDTAEACTSHTDSDGNEKCDSCGAKLPHTACRDADENAICDICAKPVACVTHKDVDQNAACDVCGQFVPCETCIDLNEDGYCDRCYDPVECVQHKDNDQNLICDVCGDLLPCVDHVDNDKNAKCDFCGIAVECETHADIDKNQICDVCGQSTKCLSCTDGNLDLVCDACFAKLECTAHVDSDKNAVCDICGERVKCAACVDLQPRNGLCDVCGEEVACDKCIDQNKDAKCDFCSKDVACDECVDINHDLKCDVCLGYVACTEHKDENLDAECDWCEERVECESCVDEDEDDVCDVCGGDMPLPDGLVLVRDGACQFTFVIGEEAGDEILLLVQDMIAELESIGIDAEWVYAGEGEKTSCEILIGVPSDRGAEYEMDIHTLGYEGYIIEPVGEKLMVYGGSEEALSEAVTHLSEVVFEIGTVDSINNLVFTEEMKVDEKQTEYRITSISIGGNNVADYVIAVDMNDAVLMETALGLRDSFYKRAGYWLEIVSYDAVSGGAIIIEQIENDGSEGFVIELNGGELRFTSMFANRTKAQVDSFITKNVIAKSGDINLTSELSAIINVRDVYYKDYGAVGDGVTDDLDAIIACHAEANAYGHVVYADRGATYYIGIGHGGNYATIQTDTYWGNAKFIFDDSQLLPYIVNEKGQTVSNPEWNSPIFHVKRDNGSFVLTNEFKDLTLNEGDTNIGFAPGYPCLIRIYNSNVRHFIRYGPNQNSGSSMTEILLVDAEGNIDPTTPVQWSYTVITDAYAYRVDDKPITISGGHFTTRYNHAPSEYTYLDRNIDIQRSNVTVKDIVHVNVDFGPTGAPMTGFTYTANANNVRFENIEFNNAKSFSTIGSAGTLVGMGSYEINLTACSNVWWVDCTQSNFYDENGEVKGQGMMGSNYCKNMFFVGCKVCSFDAHCGTYNATLIDSELEHINFIGEGTIYLERVTIHVDPKSYMINLRDDYGSTWEGDLVMKDCHIETKKTSITDISLINVRWYNHFFGYLSHLPHTIKIDGLTMSRYDNVRLHLYKNLEGIDVDISDPTIEFPDMNGDIKPVLNPYVTTKTVYLNNVDPRIVWVFPNTPQFAKMMVYKDGKLFNWQEENG